MRSIPSKRFVLVTSFAICFSAVSYSLEDDKDDDEEGEVARSARGLLMLPVLMAFLVCTEMTIAIMDARIANATTKSTILFSIWRSRRERRRISILQH